MPDGYFVAESTSYVNWMILRGFLVDGKPEASSRMFRGGLKIYPLSEAGDPPAMEFIKGSGQSFNTVHANDFEFFPELDQVIQREPVEMIEPELRGLISSIGIRKGVPFAPDHRSRRRA